MPFCTLLSRAEAVFLYCSCASFTSPLVNASRKLRRLPRTWLLLARLISVFFTVCLARFSEETWFAIYKVLTFLWEWDAGRRQAIATPPAIIKCMKNGPPGQLRTPVSVSHCHVFRGGRSAIWRPIPSRLYHF